MQCHLGTIEWSVFHIMIPAKPRGRDMEVMALSDRCVAAPSGGECFVGAGATSVRTLLLSVSFSGSHQHRNGIMRSGKARQAFLRSHSRVMVLSSNGTHTHNKDGHDVLHSVSSQRVGRRRGRVSIGLCGCDHLGNSQVAPEGKQPYSHSRFLRSAR